MITGQVKAEGRPISGAVIRVAGSTIVAVSDEEGYYRMGQLHDMKTTLECTLMGFKTQRRTIQAPHGESLEFNWDLVRDYLLVDQVVVTGDRRRPTRRETPVVISTVSPKLMRSLSTVSLSDGMSFLSGLRMEYNCQNCGFNQVRMNDFPGEYSQILINGRPLFGSVLGVYGMEMLPTAMVKNIEVLRGGGSSLYGSSAVGGTVNIILQEPQDNIFEVTFQGAATGVGLKGNYAGNIEGMDKVPVIAKPDMSISFNGAVVTQDSRAGMSVWDAVRSREPFDATGDGISEFPLLRMANVGMSAYHRLGQRAKLNATYFYIYEKRRGGDRFNAPVHVASVAEAPNHSIHNFSISYDQMLRIQDQLNVGLGFQHLQRDSYYSGYSLADYGLTSNWILNAGINYTAYFRWNAALAANVEFNAEYLYDRKCTYFNLDDPEWLAKHLKELTMGAPAEEFTSPSLVDGAIVANQRVYTAGALLQYNQKFPIGSVTLGARFYHFSVLNKDKSAQGNAKGYVGNVPVPRVTFLFDLIPELQLRANYSMGYRVPVVYNEELHEESSGVRRVFIRNAEGLKPEYSHSAMLSLDYNQQFDSWAVGCLVEGFYTHLFDAFISDRGEPDQNNDVTLTRKNSPVGARVYCANLEFNVVPLRGLSFRLGATAQKSEYLKVDPDLNEGQKDFLRTPNAYGYLVGQWNAWKGLTLDAALSVTGSMKIFYEYGTNKGQSISAAEKALLDADPNAQIIRKTPWFADLGLNVSYKIPFHHTALTVFAGAKNIFNAFQCDFDQGPDRASSYTYGSMTPRILYAGITFGNIF